MKHKRSGRRIAAWFLCLIMMLGIGNLPEFAPSVNAEITIETIRIEDLNWPKEGDEPDTEFTIHCYSKRFELESTAVSIDWNNSMWYYYPFGPGAQPHDNNGALFALGMKYGIRIFLSPAEGYSFSTTAPPKIYINDDTEPLEVHFPRSDGSCLYVEKTFPSLAYEDVTELHSASIVFDDKTVPKEGKVIDQSVYPFFTDPRIVLIATSPQPWGQYFDGIGWSTCPKGSTFEAGRQYRVHLECIPINKGMQCKFARDFTPVIKGYDYKYGYRGEEHIYVDIFMTCMELNKVNMELKAPKPGATTAYTTYSIPSDAYYKASVRWVTNDDAETPVTQFKDGNEYKAIIRFSAKSGYHFGRYYAIDSDGSNIFEAKVNGGRPVYREQDVNNQWIEFSRVFACGGSSQKAFNYLSVSDAMEPEVGKLVPTDAGAPTVRTEHGVVGGSYIPITFYEPHTFYWYKNEAGVKYMYQPGDPFVERTGPQGLTISYELNAAGGYTVLSDGFSARVNGRVAETRVEPLGSKTYIIMDIDFAAPVVEESRICSHSLQKKYTPATTAKDGYIEYVCSKCEECVKVAMVSKIRTIALSTDTYTYDGTTQNPQITIKDMNGKTLVKETDYTITIPAGRKKVGKYTYKVTFKDKYDGTKSLSFKINPAKAVIRSITPGSKKMTVKMTGAPSGKGATNYQIYYKQKGTSTWKKTSTTSYYKTIKNLKKGKYYYVKVRAYKKIGTTTYYGAWSTTKKVRIR